MNVFRDISEFEPADKTAVTIGNFDGIHQGHRVLLSELTRCAEEHSFAKVVVTFDPHPIEVLNPGARVPRLTGIERKAELLEQCGVDCLVVLNTNAELLAHEYADFFRIFVIEKLNAGAMVEGPNFFFGRNREGTTERLAKLCDDAGIDLSIVQISESQNGVTSSSKIREMILEGQIEEANRLLVKNYQLKGRVSAGASRGREIGFPTANLSGIEVLVPGEGVYAGRASLHGELIPAAIHIGPNPTFEDKERKVEVHLIGQDISIYDQDLRVDVLKKIRGIQKFENPNELISQIENDLTAIDSYLNSLSS